MVYKWALFRHQNPSLGRFFEFFVIVLSIVSISLPMISERIWVLGLASCLALFCLITFAFFAVSDKARKRMFRNKD